MLFGNILISFRKPSKDFPKNSPAAASIYPDQLAVQSETYLTKDLVPANANKNHPIQAEEKAAELV